MDLSGLVPDFVAKYHKKLKRGPISCEQSDPEEKQKAFQWLIRNRLAEIVYADQNSFKIKARY